MISIKELLSQEPLFVFALEQEAADFFADTKCLATGVGKVNATYSLTKAISSHPPSIIVNIGSAGSARFKQGEVVCCTSFIQRDMDATALGFKAYETPFSSLPPVLHYGLASDLFPCVTCGSGDNFHQAHEETVYQVVDMEAYALSLVAMREEIPFLCLKYITDGADEQAAKDWSTSVAGTAAVLKNALLTIHQFNT